MVGIREGLATRVLGRLGPLYRSQQGRYSSHRVKETGALNVTGSPRVFSLTVGLLERAICLIYSTFSW